MELSTSPGFYHFFLFTREWRYGNGGVDLCSPGIAQNFNFCFLLSVRCWRREYIKDGKYRKGRYIFLSFLFCFSFPALVGN